MKYRYFTLKQKSHWEMASSVGSTSFGMKKDFEKMGKTESEYRRLQIISKKIASDDNQGDNLKQYYRRIFPKRLGRGFAHRGAVRVVSKYGRISPMKISRIELPEGFSLNLTNDSPFKDLVDLSTPKEISQYITLKIGSLTLPNIINWSESWTHFKDITFKSVYFAKAIAFLKGLNVEKSNDILFEYEGFKKKQSPMKNSAGELEFLDSERHTTSVTIQYHTKKGTRYVTLTATYEFSFSCGGGGGYFGSLDVSDPKILRDLKGVLETIENM